MKLKLILYLALVVTSLFLKNSMVSVGLAEEASVTVIPKFAGHELPQPPRQHRAWKPPTKDLPANLISSAQVLFDLGLADPRGCEYREFETVVGSVWGNTQIITAHGWILPDQSGRGPQGAIGWNGLVYPAIRVGKKVSLKRDVAALLTAEEMWRQAAATNRFVAFDGPWSLGVPSEGYSISETNLTEIKMMLLLRLGEWKLAQAYWDGRQIARHANEVGEDARDPFRELAYAWAWSLFDRAICAHMRGDDALALADCRQLSHAWPELEQETGRRGFQRPAGLNFGQKPLAKMETPYFDFLKPLPALLADEERRVKEPANRIVLPGGLDKFPGQTERIAVLISNLDEVDARQWGQPGGVSLNFDPVVTALSAEGDAAVEPLLDCMENDRRLTRSVSFWRDFGDQRNLVSVQDAAQATLKEILKVDFRTATEYRSYWQTYKLVSPSERWYQTLLDDQAGRPQWMQAARNILSRTDGKLVYPWKNSPAPDKTNDYRYVAESLRSKTGPTVTDLFLKRALQIAPTNYVSSEDCWTFMDAANLGLMLAEWNPQTAAPALKKIMLRCPVLYADAPERWGSGCAVVPKLFAALVVALAERGDDSGLDLYAKWLSRQTLDDLQDALPEVLSPLGRFPDHPSIKETSVKLFQMEKFNWLGDWLGSDLLRTRLVRNEQFRLLILNALTDKSTAGTFVLGENGQYNIMIQGGQEGGRLELDALAPKVNETVSFRVCDDIARRLSRIVGLPELKLYWPEARRDAAVADVIKFLKDNGHNLKLKSAAWPLDEN